MARIRITVIEGCCRDKHYKKGDSWICDGTLPPLCYELGLMASQYLYCLENGGKIDGERNFTIECPDRGTKSGKSYITIRGEVIDD